MMACADSSKHQSPPNPENSILAPNPENSILDSSLKRVACQEVAKAKSVSEIGAALNNLTEAYYRDVLNQAQASFVCALIASVIGAGFFFGAVQSTMVSSVAQPITNSRTNSNEAAATSKETHSAPNVSLIAGALVEVIAGINFYLYARASRQFSSFHICLERANRYLLVNMLCDSLDEKADKALMRKKLIQTMLDAPMLTIAEVTGVLERTESRAKGKEEQAAQAAVSHDKDQATQEIHAVENGIAKT